MNGFGPPNRSTEPLRVLAMAAALIAAAVAGAGIGYLIDFIGGGEATESGNAAS